MAVRRAVAVSLAVVALGENQTCGADGECKDEESSLLQSFVSRSDLAVEGAQTQWWFGKKGFSNCRNREGVEFPCGEYGSCCGDICANKEDVCCKNVQGYDFACQGGGGGCCGNSCFAPGSKCCMVGSPSQWYPVTKDTECAVESSSKTCTNRNGNIFLCGPNSRCGGDICLYEGSKQCQNANGNDFACGPDSECCGNACAAPGSKCCKVGSPSQWYPVTKDTECAAESSSKTCANRNGDSFLCGPNSECGGDICLYDGSKHCKNAHGNDFPCGPESQCCGNACAAPGSKCCKVGSKSQWYPVTKDTECAVESKTCTNRFGDSFLCGPNSQCGGDICLGEGSKQCQNANGHDFACGPNSQCCGNACAGPNSKCCKCGSFSEWYPVTKNTKCRCE